MRPDYDYKLSRVPGTLPSEYRGGKVSHDDDYRAGYRAGQKWVEENGKASITNADIDKLYHPRWSNIHGSWWKDGFMRAVEIDRGIATKDGEYVTYRLGLIRNNPSHKPGMVDATGFGFYTVSPYVGLFALQNMRDGGLASIDDQNH